jgi:hypothetical protein
MDRPARLGHRDLGITLVAVFKFVKTPLLLGVWS